MRKAKRKGQRILAAALCVGMLASMVPAQAFAEDAQPAQSIVEQQDVTDEAAAPSPDPAADTDEAAAPSPDPAADTDEAETPTPAPSETPVESPAPAETETPTETPAAETPAPAADQNNTETPKDEATPTPAAATLEAVQPQAVNHIATNVGQIPAGIDWADDVTANTFAEPYATVTAKDKTGTAYTVEVIPADTVYFIDSVAAAGGNGTMDKVQSTPAYAAAAALLGDKLLNDKSDQFYQGSATWGLVDTDAQTKGYNNDTSDKTYTGIYGAHNEAGETISYNFTLPAGKYKITTAHREWWGDQNRAMDLTLTTDSGTTTYASVPQQANNAVTIKTGDFTITSKQVVTWTATTTGDKAPAVSWLAVERTGEADEPDTPEAPNENFGKELEEGDGLLTLYTAQANDNRTDISLVQDELNGYGNVLTLTGTAWNNNNGGYAAINNAPSYFKRTQFTLLADLKVNFAAKNDGRAAAFTIGKDGQNLHIFTNQGKLGCGSNNNGVSSTQVDLAGAKSGEWNAMALTYQETETGAKVIVYLNGEKAAEIADVGFKLSSQADLKGMICRAFGTNYLMNGQYDKIVVQDTAMGEDEAKTITQERLAAKANAVNVDGVVSLTGAEVEKAAQNVNGWTYKGLGMLNGNSTSNLLLDYKAESPKAYEAMMQYLFGGEYPLFTNIKMEMGNDGNNSTGAEACTMRYEDEEADASRSPGFVMAADAKAINSNVKVSILRWGCPNWVNAYKKDDDKTDWYAAIYKWYKETIFDAYEKYGYVVDYINPDTNETEHPDGGIIKYFANALKNEKDFPSYFDQAAIDAYHNIKIVASDENKTLEIVPLMRKDKDVYDAVDAIGFHYRTNATDDYIAMADVDDKEVWYSEGCATFGYSELQENKTAAYGGGTIGGYQSPLALLDSIPNAFIGSRRTMYMFQPAIGSFYEGIQYGHKELLSARDPWSGYIHYDPVLYMLGHITKFAKTGWENSTNTNGIWRVLPGATYASFGASGNEHATAGMDGNASYMTLAAPDKTNFSTVFVNNTRNDKTFAIKVSDMNVAVNALHVWTTATNSYMQPGKDAAIENGIAYITVPAYSVVTATTLDTEPERFPTETKDGDYIHTADRAVLDTDSTGKKIDTGDDFLYADNFDYKEENDNYLTERGNEPRYMLDTHGAWIVEDGQLKQENASGVTQWNGGDPATIVGDWRWMDYGASLDVTLPNADGNRYERLTIRAQTGMNWNNSGYTLEINGTGNWKLYRIGTVVESGSVPKNAKGKYSLRLAGLGDTVYAYVNGIRVASYTDANPMLSGRVKISSNWTQVYADNLEVKRIPGGIPYATAMIDGQDDGVQYEGTWSIEYPGGGNADNWYRTISSSSSADAAFTFKINGNGFAIMGGNDGSATLDVYVDNQLKESGAATKAAPTRGEAYILSGLADGEHTIKVVLKSGKLNIDALNTIGTSIAPVANPATVATSQGEIEYYVTESGTLPGLAENAKVTFADNSDKDLPIAWNLDKETLDSSIFSSAAIYGTVGDVVDDLGYPLVTSVTIKEVVPNDTVYFIDAGVKEGGTSPSYDIYQKALKEGQLLNDTFDQSKTEENTWGRVTANAHTYSKPASTDKTETGIFADLNQTGETLIYAMTLPAGSYTLTSAHREWWNGRGMTVVVRDEDGKELSKTGTVQVSYPNYSLATQTFHIAKDTTVQYVVTATGNNAPVLSWLAVQQQPTETAVRPEPGLNRVPEGLKDIYTSAQEITAALEQKLDTIIQGGHVAVYDVKLMLKFSNGIWEEAETEEDVFPAEGVEIRLPLPGDVTVDTFDKFDIAVAHMISTGDKAGEIEQVTPVTLDRETGELVMRATSLSPFAVSWKAKVTEPDTPDQPVDPGKPDQPNQPDQPNTPDTPSQPSTPAQPDHSADNSNTAASGSAKSNTAPAAKNSPAKDSKTADTAAAAKTARVPQTSDNFPIVPIAAAALLSLNGLIVLILRKRENK